MIYDTIRYDTIQYVHPLFLSLSLRDPARRIAEIRIRQQIFHIFLHKIRNRSFIPVKTSDLYFPNVPFLQSRLRLTP